MTGAFRLRQAFAPGQFVSQSHSFSATDSTATGFGECSSLNYSLCPSVVNRIHAKLRPGEDLPLRSQRSTEENTGKRKSVKAEAKTKAKFNFPFQHAFPCKPHEIIGSKLLRKPRNVQTLVVQSHGDERARKSSTANYALVDFTDGSTIQS